MKTRRIFIAINLPEKIKQNLADLQYNWPSLPVRWTKKENLHITLVFLGNVSDNELPGILDSVRKASSSHSGFQVKLEKVSYGPPHKKPPRMIWAIGEQSQELASLKKDLEGSLSKTADEKEFSLHITLARIQQWEWRRMDLEEIPEINEPINIIFPVNSIEVMESRLKKGGAEYIVLESIDIEKAKDDNVIKKVGL